MHIIIIQSARIVFRIYKDNNSHRGGCQTAYRVVLLLFNIYCALLGGVAIARTVVSGILLLLYTNEISRVTGRAS